MGGISRPVLGNGQGNCPVFVQPKGSLVEDHAQFVEDGMGGPVLVHPPMGFPMHLKGDGNLMDLLDVVLALTTTSVVAFLWVVVDVGNCVVEIAPIVGNRVVVTIPVVVALVVFLMMVFADKGISKENIKAAFLVEALDVNVGHNAVALGLGDGKPRLDRPRHTGIVDTGAPLSKGTVEG